MDNELNCAFPVLLEVSAVAECGINSRSIITFTSRSNVLTFSLHEKFYGLMCSIEVSMSG
jgi:hypothetical protein